VVTMRLSSAVMRVPVAHRLMQCSGGDRSSTRGPWGARQAKKRSRGGILLRPRWRRRASGDPAQTRCKGGKEGVLCGAVGGGTGRGGGTQCRQGPVLFIGSWRCGAVVGPASRGATWLKGSEGGAGSACSSEGALAAGSDAGAAGVGDGHTTRDRGGRQGTNMWAPWTLCWV
jgi:hypothetical protein